MLGGALALCLGLMLPAFAGSRGRASEQVWMLQLAFSRELLVVPLAALVHVGAALVLADYARGAFVADRLTRAVAGVTGGLVALVHVALLLGIADGSLRYWVGPSYGFWLGGLGSLLILVGGAIGLATPYPAPTDGWEAGRSVERISRTVQLAAAAGLCSLLVFGIGIEVKQSDLLEMPLSFAVAPGLVPLTLIGLPLGLWSRRSGLIEVAGAAFAVGVLLAAIGLLGPDRWYNLSTLAWPLPLLYPAAATVGWWLGQKLRRRGPASG